MRCLGLAWYTSSNALDLQCKDLTHPLAIQTGYGSSYLEQLSLLLFYLKETVFEVVEILVLVLVWFGVCAANPSHHPLLLCVVFVWCKLERMMMGAILNGPGMSNDETTLLKLLELPTWIFSVSFFMGERIGKTKHN
jgi:hypothetical protein